MYIHLYLIINICICIHLQENYYIYCINHGENFDFITYNIMHKLKTGCGFIFQVPNHRDKNMSFDRGSSLIHWGHQIYANFNFKWYFNQLPINLSIHFIFCTPRTHPTFTLWICTCRSTILYIPGKQVFQVYTTYF